MALSHIVISRFTLNTIPATTQDLEIRNEYVRQHALNLPSRTKAIRLVVEKKPRRETRARATEEANVRCRGSPGARVIRDGEDRFVIELLDGINVVELEAGPERELYRIFIYK